MDEHALCVFIFYHNETRDDQSSNVTEFISKVGQRLIL